LDRVKVDQGGRLIAMGGEGPLVIVKVDPIQPKKPLRNMDMARVRPGYYCRPKRHN